ncbi:TetR/AcrR family transcriptional regulator [Agrococcus jejuensis]|uniref:TetR/AcrR family transcriptional regulator n=1 Tax=Agrococcus jejuensis TaxID=399736 RepID=UPI0011A128AF|nr:TetR/AcrR family transcriptional regulator [Agrococcus jejuensis]
MGRWSPDAALRLEASALSLFETQGFAETTVAQIAAGAGLTTRTFFRHFADKRDVMFLRDRELPLVVEESLRGVDAATSSADAVRLGLEIACRGLEPLHEDFARRRAIIRTEQGLVERNLLSRRHLAGAIAAALVDRGTDARDAALLADVAAACFELAVETWLEPRSGRTLVDAQADLWRRARELFDA